MDGRRRQRLFRGLHPGGRVVAQVQRHSDLFQQRARGTRLPIAARITRCHGVESGTAQRVDVADYTLREGLDVDDDVVGHQLLGPVAAAPAQAGPHIGPGLVQREPR